METTTVEKISSKSAPVPTTVPSSSDTVASDSLIESVPNHNIDETPTRVQASVLKTSSESGLLPTIVPSSSDILTSDELPEPVSNHNISETPTGVHASGPPAVNGPATYLPDAPACKLFEDPGAWKDITFDAIEDFHKFYHEYAYEAVFSWRKMSTVSRRCRSDGVTRIRYARLGCQNEGYKDGSALDPKNKDDEHKQFLDSFRTISPLTAIVSKMHDQFYTPKIFKNFQNEYANSMDLSAGGNFPPVHGGGMHEITWCRITMPDAKRVDEHVVTFSLDKFTYECTCLLFDSSGWLCRHILRTMDTISMLGNTAAWSIPTFYMRSRWSVMTKKGAALHGFVVECMEQETEFGRFQRLCGSAIPLSTDAAINQE
ncbi:Protein FAR-RED ELONGATED HYPOCOTYL 3, partial [Linum perenne]